MKTSIWQKSISYGNSPTTKGQFNATAQNRCDQGPQRSRGFLGGDRTPEDHASVRPAIARYPSSTPMQSGTLYCRSEQRRNTPTPALINSGRSLPIENVNQLPRVPNEIYLQLPLLIDLELGCRVEHARALALVRVIQI